MGLAPARSTWHLRVTPGTGTWDLAVSPGSGTWGCHLEQEGWQGDNPWKDGASSSHIDRMSLICTAKLGRALGFWIISWALQLP